MKLSMYMLERWFEEEHPIVTIQSGKREITGVRLFSDAILQKSEYLYVGKMSDFFEQSNSREIVLVHKTDVMYLTSSDLDDVFNRALAAFDYYNQIEITMRNGIYQENPEQCVISACESLLGPTFIMTPDYHILACSQNYQDVKVNEYWDYFSVFKRPSLKNIVKMRSSTVVKMMSKQQYMAEFIEHNAYPYEYELMSSYYNPAGMLIGYLIIASDTPTTPFARDMMEIMLEALKLIHRNVAEGVLATKGKSGGERMLLSLLDEKNCTEESTILRGLNDWKASDYFRMILIGDENSIKDRELEIIQETLKQYMGLHGIVVIHENQICCLYKLPEKEENFQNMMERLTEKFPFHIGISNPFSELQHCSFYKQQAIDALKGNDKQQIVEFQEVAVNTIIYHSNLTYKKLARHPLAIFLEQYDQRHNTKLGKTLYLYLVNERSIKKTAEQLFIHRNTVLYRLKKIEELYAVNLESVEERMYLMISLRMMCE